MYDPHYERLINNSDNLKPQVEYECFNVSSAIVRMIVWPMCDIPVELMPCPG